MFLTSLKSINVVLLCSFGYLLFVPSGPFPIYVYGSVKLDVIFAALLLASLIPYIDRYINYPKDLLFAFICYVLISFITVLGSNDLIYSFKSWLAMLGYLLITLLLPLCLYEKASILRGWIFVCAVSISVLIVILYHFFGYGDGFRFSLAIKPLENKDLLEQGKAFVDQNMTASGLYLSLLIYIPDILQRKKLLLVRILEVVGVILILTAGIITLSRTAFVGLVGSVMVVSIIAMRRWLSSKQNKIDERILIKGLFSAILIVMFLMCIYILNFDIFNYLVSRLITSTADTARLQLITNALHIFTLDVKTFFIGSGYMITNPHNEFLRALSSMGILGVLSSIIMLVVLFKNVLGVMSNDSPRQLAALAVIFYVIIISMFYGYTKLIWVAWMFLLLQYFEIKGLLCEK